MVTARYGAVNKIVIKAGTTRRESIQEQDKVKRTMVRGEVDYFVTQLPLITLRVV